MSTSTLSNRKKANYKIVSNRQLSKNTFELVLEGEGHNLHRPGQFVNVKVEPFFLRRPLSVCESWEGGMRIVYKILGEGTKVLSTFKPGKELSLLINLGNSFDFDPILQPGRELVLIAGGIGVPPLFALAKEMHHRGLEMPTVILGFQEGAEVFLVDELEEMGCRVLINTDDGSAGNKGLVTDGFIKYMESEKPENVYVCACGPVAMLRALAKVLDDYDVDGQFTMEERMACGFGACFGCSVATKDGAMRIGVEGPVFDRRDLIW